METAAPPRRRRAVRTISSVLIALGVLVLADGLVTLVWQEPLTSLQAHFRQRALSHDLRNLERAGPTRMEARVLANLQGERRRIAFLARSLKRRTAEGAAIGRIEIPRIGASFVLVKGANGPELRKGPGTYDQAPFPGAPGTAAIAGHRTTYLAPFRHIDRLRPGDRITVEMPYGRFDYRVQGTRIVAPDALWILRRQRYDRLVLSACHPLFSATHRIVVFARMSRVVPLRAALPGRGSDGRLQPLTPSPT